jgi:anti-sigma factor RsiW
MTHPTEPFSTPVAGSCEAFQWEISQALDERRTFSDSARAHLHTCPACAAFAEAWGEDGGLAGPLAHTPATDPAVAHRLVQAALATDAPARLERSPRGSRGWLFRAVAVLALGALGWWLMDPRVVPGPPPATARTTGASPVLAMNRQMARLEGPMAREQAALQGAAVSGFTRLREIFDRSSTVLQ